MVRIFAVLTLLATTWPGALTSVTAQQDRVVDIAIFSYQDGQPAYDACYELVGLSEVKCDDNGDGKVVFADIPLGIYAAHQTADLGPWRSVDDFIIGVTGNLNSEGFQSFSASIHKSPGSSAISGSLAHPGMVDIALITRDPETGDPITSACYELVDYSEVGCDENSSGQVMFAAIPYGVYTVHQTRTPAGYPTINDYDINVEPVEGLPGVEPFGLPLGFVVKQALEQNAPDTRNVSVVLIDMTTHEKLVAGACAQLVGGSLLGCDDDVPDGQIDFLDIPAGGPYGLSFSNLPAGSTIGEVCGPLAVSIDAGSNAPSHQFVFVLVAMPGTASSGGDVASTQPPTVGNAAETVVEADGFSLTLEGISVSGGSDVAAAGTSVHAQLIEAELPADVSRFAMAAGRGVEITLGDSIQPAEPLAITFAPDVVKSWGATSDSGGDLYPVVFVSKPDDSGMEMADAQMLPDGSVEVTADHLSRFLPSLVSINQFMDWFGDEVLIFSESRSRQPDCATRTAEDVGWVFSAPPGSLIWLCAQDMAGNGVLTTFTNNGPLVWRVSSAQATPGLPKTSSIIGESLSLVHSGVYDPATTTWLFPPDGSTTFETIGQDDEIQFNVVLDRAMTPLYALLRGLLVFTPAKVVEKLGQAECFVKFVPTWLDTAMAQEAADLDIAGVAGTVMGCMASVMSGLPGTVISALATLPGALAAPIEELILGLIGRDAFTVTLTKLGNVTVRPIANSSGHGWPTDRNDSAQGLYAWIGASSVWPGTGISGMPDWVACDNARAYCLLGYDDEDHVLVQIRGFEIIGTIADWYPNPKEALLILGLTEEVADQILGI